MAKSKLLTLMLGLVLVVGVLAAGCQQAPEEGAAPEEEKKAPEEGAAEKPSVLKGTAYVAGEGGHFAVVNLAEAMKNPDSYIPGKMDITPGAGSELAGEIAGGNVENVAKQRLKELGLDVEVVKPEEVFANKCAGCHGEYPGDKNFKAVEGEDNQKWREGIEEMLDEGKVSELSEEEIGSLARDLAVKHGGSVTQGGTHGLALDPNNPNFAVGGTLGGQARVFSDLEAGKKSELMDVGEKFCDTIWGPQGFVYFTDMANGKIYKFDPDKQEVADVILAKSPDGSEQAKSICGIQFLDEQGKMAILADMPQGKIFLTNMKTGEIQQTAKVATFIHQAQLTPDKSELWVSSPNEFNVAEGLAPWSLAGKTYTGIDIVDTETFEVKNEIKLEGRFPHDIEFTPDGKYALLATRTYVPQGTDYLTIVDTKAHEVMNEIDACGSCHNQMGVLVKVNEGIPNLCGVDVDWSNYESAELEKKGYVKK